MSALQYGNNPGVGVTFGEKYHYSQFVHLPHGITKLSGQGGWTIDGDVDGEDWKGQIEKAVENVETVLKVAGLSGWEDVYLVRSYMTNIAAHFEYFTEVMKKRIPHRPVYTALSVPQLGLSTMIIEIEVEAYRK